MGELGHFCLEKFPRLEVSGLGHTLSFFEGQKFNVDKMPAIPKCLVKCPNVLSNRLSIEEQVMISVHKKYFAIYLYFIN